MFCSLTAVCTDVKLYLLRAKGILERFEEYNGYINAVDLKGM